MPEERARTLATHFESNVCRSLVFCCAIVPEERSSSAAGYTLLAQQISDQSGRPSGHTDVRK